MQKSVDSPHPIPPPPTIPGCIRLRHAVSGVRPGGTGTMSTAATKPDLTGTAERKPVLIQLGFLLLLKAHSDDFERSGVKCWNPGRINK